MIKYRGQRVDDGELVEGLLSSIFVDPTPITGEKDIEVRTAIKSNPYSYWDARNHEIHPSTLQVMTTDGWADIADVEVVRKKAADVVNESLYTQEQFDYVMSVPDIYLRSHLLHQVRLRDNMEADRNNFEAMYNDLCIKYNACQLDNNRNQTQTTPDKHG